MPRRSAGLSEELTQASHKLAEAMYQQAAAQSGEAGAGADPGAREDGAVQQDD